MKKNILKILLGALLIAAIGTNIITAQEIATKVRWYDFPTSMPDVTTSEFGTTRDNHLTRIKMGGALATGSRVNNPTGLEVRRSSEAGDFSVSGGGTFLWRSVFNPGGMFATMHGQRNYDTMLMVGEDGKVSPDRMSYQVLCGVGLLSNQATLMGLNYSVSRIGIQAGPDGKLFTPDDVFLQNGEAGTTLVDAVLFIGARIGASINNSQDLAALNAAIPSDGTYVIYRYMFQSDTSIVTHDCVTWIYRQGEIPAWRNTVEVFRGPKGLVFSLVGPQGTAQITLHSSRHSGGPWNLENAAATEGTSGYWAFTGTSSDEGYFKLGTQAVAVARSPNTLPSEQIVAAPDVKLVSSPGTETDQDR